MARVSSTDPITSQLSQQAIDAAGTVLAANPELLKLRMLQTPDPVSVWPPAIGWWVLLAALLASLLASWIIRKRARSRNAFHLEANQLLTQAFDRWQNERADPQYLGEAASILRRTAITMRGAYPVARLTGSAWANELNQLSGAELPASTLLALTDQLYQAQPNTDIVSVHQHLTHWLSHLKTQRQLQQVTHA